jgi:hypothetical protein
VKRDSALVLVLALLALLALGVGGATLNDPSAASGEGLFGSGGGSANVDQSDQGATNGSTGGGGPSGVANWTGACLEAFDTLPVRIGLTLFVLGLSVAVGRRSDAPWLAGGLTFVLSGFLVHLLFSLLTACGPLLPAMSGGRGARGRPTPDELGNGSAGGGGANAVQTVTSEPSLLLAVLLVVAIGAAVFLLVFASGDTTTPDPDREAEAVDEEPDVAAVGRAAGRAADRIDEGDDGFENDVYRAWVEMTDHLAVDHPESSTPAEFADAAVEAGMGADDVNELTRLFEEVRYGDYAVTGERESRAVDALRRIEARYADADASAGADADTDADTDSTDSRDAKQGGPGGAGG